jgi:hypothetical protein
LQIPPNGEEGEQDDEEKEAAAERVNHEGNVRTGVHSISP